MVASWQKSSALLVTVAFLLQSCAAAVLKHEPGADNQHAVALHRGSDADGYWPVSVLILVMVVGALGMIGIYRVLDAAEEEDERENPRPDPETANWDKAGIVLEGHRIPWQQYFAFAFWCLLLITLGAFTRLICHVGVPHDCHLRLDMVKWVYDVHLLLAYGGALAILTGLTSPERFEYLFCFKKGDSGDIPVPRGVLFLALFFLSSPFWGMLDLVPALSSFTLKTGNSVEPVNMILLALVSFGFLALIGWHMWYAYLQNPLKGFVAYVVSRFGICLLYSAYFGASSQNPMTSFHLHHYLVGFLCAMFAAFNHPMSLALLAVASGIMVQGICAYDADYMVEAN